MGKENDEKRLQQLRGAIDATDELIVQNLARRRRLVLKLAALKGPLGVPVFDRRRERELLARVRALGQDAGLDAEFVGTLYRLVLMDSKEAQYDEVR